MKFPEGGVMFYARFSFSLRTREVRVDRLNPKTKGGLCCKQAAPFVN